MKSIAVFYRFLACGALYVSLGSHSQNGICHVVSKNQPAKMSLKISENLDRKRNKYYLKKKNTYQCLYGYYAKHRIWETFCLHLILKLKA